MPLHVKRGEIDRDNNPVGKPETIASFDERATAETSILGEIGRYDHNGFVADGHQAGWWGRNDRDHTEKFHFWIEDDAEAAPAPLRDEQYRGIP